MIDTLLRAMPPLKEWFEAISSHKKRRDEEHEEAIEALYTALNETRIYIGRINRAGESHRDEDTEAKLSRLWTKASRKLRKVDSHLAKRCFMKGDYWANPDGWTEEDIARARIQIDKVFRAARRLL